jgi:hypothetical protein
MYRLDTSRSLTRAAASVEMRYIFKESTRGIQLKSFQTHGGQLRPWWRPFLWPGKTPGKHSTLTSVLAMRKPTGATMDTS